MLQQLPLQSEQATEIPKALTQVVRRQQAGVRAIYGLLLSFGIVFASMISATACIAIQGGEYSGKPWQV